MTRGKLKVVKQEMARVNIDILGICKLKCIEMGGFNSDDHCLNHYGTQKARDAFVVFDQTLEESLTSEDSDHKLPQIGWLKKAGILSL